MKILFQGDSVTDANRDRTDAHNLGEGYVKYAVELLCKKYPEKDFEFLNFGISANHTHHLVERLQTDFLDINPDIVSILIGVNDAWHEKSESWSPAPDSQFEANYRTVLEGIKQKTNAKIMMLEPFSVPNEEESDYFRPSLISKIEIVRRLAREYADVYMPTDALLASEYLKTAPEEISADGVHPIEKGARIIAGWYADYISQIIDNL